MKQFRVLLAVLLLSLFRPSVFAADRKLSPYVRQAVRMSSRVRSAKSAVPRRRQELCAFVKTASGGADVFSEYALKPLAEFGDISIVSLPVALIPRLSADDRVLRIEASRSAHVLLDTVGIQINALPAYAGTDLPQAFTGEGVVMGIQDVGFDLTHPNFFSSSGDEYRIKAFWDQLSTDTIGSSLYVGADYEGDSELLSYARSRDNHLITHGTHTLGIAAGSGAGTPYRGIAPDADICLVNNAVTTDVVLIDSLDLYKYTSATDALGFKYIFDYADRVGKPCVISFSEGSHQDFRGDDQLYFETLSRLAGPGRIIVSSAGNNGYYTTYIEKPAGDATAGTFLRNYDENYVFTTLCSSGPFTLRITSYGDTPEAFSITTNELCLQPDSNLIDTITLASRRYPVDIYCYRSCYNPDDIIVEFYAEDEGKFAASQPFSIEAVGAEARVEFFNIYGRFTTNARNSELTDGECTHSINSPSACEDVICVGSTTYRTGFVNYRDEYVDQNWDTGGRRGRFSSVGPTHQGLVKPDVLAPGANVISSMSSYFIEAATDAGKLRFLVETMERGGRVYGWEAQSGTSMSSPAVGGAIALWLQARPTLTRDEIIDVFAHTCRRTSDTDVWPNNTDGWGEIDVYRGLLYILGIDAIDGISLSQPEKARFRVTGEGNLVILSDLARDNDFTLSVYSVGGQKLLTTHVGRGHDNPEVSLASLPRGLYVVQIGSSDPRLSGSTIIRR